MMATITPSPSSGPNKTSSKHKSSKPAFLNMSTFVVGEVGQEAVLECRVENLARQFMVRIF